MNLEELKKIKTKTTAYLLPIVANKNNKYVDFKDDELFPKCNFINTFRFCNLYPDLDSHVFILYKYSINSTFSNFINRFKTFMNYHTTISNNENFIIIVFKIPVDSFKSLNHFDKGEYSKFRIEDKKKILNFYSVTTNDMFDPVGVLYKKDWRKLEIEQKIGLTLPESAELSSIPNLEHETLFIENK